MSTTASRLIGIAPGNAEAAKAWDGDEGAYWARHADRFDASVAGYHQAFLDAAGLGAGDDVLDIGCGTGQTTRDAARAVGAGTALGIDLSSAMLAVARTRSAMDGLVNVRFEQGDAQVHPFPSAGFDAALSRTGAMFFENPVTAFANVRRALRPGGRLVLLVWRHLADNAWARELLSAMAGRSLAAPPVAAPGPFSMADPDRVREQLTAAGLTDVRHRALHAPMTFGADVDDAQVFVLGLLDWMIRDQDAAARDAAVSRLRTSLAAHAGPSGVTYDSAAWLITARPAGSGR